jgi:hypothetical protein
MLGSVCTLQASTRDASPPVFSMTSPLGLILTILVLWKRSITSPALQSSQQCNRSSTVLLSSAEALTDCGADVQQTACLQSQQLLSPVLGLLRRICN